MERLDWDIEFEIPGEPQALKRHRSFKMGDRISQYDPSKGDKADFLAKVMQHKPDIPFDEPLYLKLGFYFSRPKGHYGTGKNAGKLKASAPEYHTKVPDSDNLTKFVCDSLNKVFWRDDSIIAALNVTKKYTDRPRITVKVYRILKPRK